MPLTGAFIVPHPPIILTEIGLGSEIQIAATINAYLCISYLIAKSNVDTVVIVSPHAPMAADKFIISGGDHSVGSFASFGVPALKVGADNDRELIDLIASHAEKSSIPVTIDETPDPLDHGTMIPLKFIKSKSPNVKLVRIAFSELSLETHYEFGKVINEAIAASGKNVAVVASCDLSHRLQKYGPYGFAKEGPLYDEQIVKICGSGDLHQLVTFDEEIREKAMECGHRYMTILGGAIEGMDLTPEVLSYERVTGVGYMVCEFK